MKPERASFFRRLVTLSRTVYHHLERILKKEVSSTMSIGKVIRFIKRIWWFLRPIEARSMNDFIDLIKDENDGYKVKLTLKDMKWTDRSRHAVMRSMLFIVEARSSAGKPDVFFSEWVEEGSVEADRITDLKRQKQFREAGDGLKERIKRSVPSMEITTKIIP
jgi:hypothetical protein